MFYFVSIFTLPWFLFLFLLFWVVEQIPLEIQKLKIKRQMVQLANCFFSLRFYCFVFGTKQYKMKLAFEWTDFFLAGGERSKFSIKRKKEEQQNESAVEIW